MKKTVAVLLALTTAILFGSTVNAGEVEISAHAAILYDPLTETILYERRSDEAMPMASTTKIMTALLAFESGRAEEPVEISQEMVNVEGSSMGLMPGDVLTLGSIAEGMLLASGNDGANAVALFLGGSTEGFAQMMNARAAEIGMTDTCFVTASGLDAEGHASTAYDMALLATEAMQCQEFRDTVGSFSAMVHFIEPEKTVRYDNHNRLLTMYDGCCGIKTGFTKKAGRCLVSAAKRDDAELICVTLNASDDWNDHMKLFEYGFERFESGTLSCERYSVPVVGGMMDEVLCGSDAVSERYLLKNAEVAVRAELPRFIYAPVEKGEKIGKVIYSVHGRDIAEAELYAENDIGIVKKERSKLYGLLGSLFGGKQRKIFN